MEQKIQEPECCPKFDPVPWDNQVIEWDNKKFIRDKVFTFLHMPVNFGGAMRRMNTLVEKSKAGIPDWLCLSEHTSKWNMALYLAVDKEVNGANNTTLSGKYFCKVYNGPYRNTGKWMKDFDQATKDRGYEIKKMYM
ncbi:MAG: hypothetical protein K0B15_15370 [Lentimicrobium sp.]|nr:hypothetical protein [Lentimicrobium sp.]